MKVIISFEFSFLLENFKNLLVVSFREIVLFGVIIFKFASKMQSLINLRMPFFLLKNFILVKSKQKGKYNFYNLNNKTKKKILIIFHD